MRVPVIVAAALMATQAAAQQPTDSFLPEPSEQATLDRSALRCSQMGCAPPTSYWWATVALSCKTLTPFWVVIEDGGNYGPSGLTPDEASSLVAYNTLAADGCFDTEGSGP